MDGEGHQFLVEAILFHMTPSYYDKLTGRSHFEPDVELVYNLPVAQFMIKVYCKKLKET